MGGVVSKEEVKERKFVDFLTDFDVEFVSLVDHGGIRAPFKIIRSDGSGADDVIQSILVPTDISIDSLKSDFVWLHDMPVERIDTFDSYRKVCHKDEKLFDKSSFKIRRLDGGVLIVSGTLLEPDPEAFILQKSLLERATWSTAYVNSLPNSSFAVIETGYKDGESPKSARHLPFKDANGKVDLPHLRNALARLNQIKPVLGNDTAEELRARAKRTLAPYAAKYLGEKSDERLDVVDDDVELGPQSSPETADLSPDYMTALQDIVFQEFNNMIGVIFGSLAMAGLDVRSKKRIVSNALDSFKTYVGIALDNAGPNSEIRLELIMPKNLYEVGEMSDTAVEERKDIVEKNDESPDILKVVNDALESQIPSLIDKSIELRMEVMTEKLTGSILEKLGPAFVKTTDDKAEERKDEEVEKVESKDYVEDLLSKIKSLEERLEKFEAADSQLASATVSSKDDESASKDKSGSNIWSGLFFK